MPIRWTTRSSADSIQTNGLMVVGVVGDARQESPAEQPGPALYMPMTQHPFYANQIYSVLRTGVKPLLLMNAVQERIAEINPLIALRFTTWTRW
jgi:putative ABC transport system permease protein